MRAIERFFARVKVFPNWVFLWGSRVNTSDFCDDSFPTVRSIVDPRDGGREIEDVTRGLVWFEGDFGLDTAVCTDDGTIVGLDEE